MLRRLYDIRRDTPAASTPLKAATAPCVAPGHKETFRSSYS
jgi:hypothetical protein